MIAVTVFLLVVILPLILLEDNNTVIAADSTPLLNINGNSSTSSDGITNAFPSSRLSNSGIEVNTFPVGIGVNPNTNKVYVANQYSNTISVINTESDKVQSTISVGNFPYGVDTNPLNNRVYVTNRGSNTVSIIDGSVDTKLLDVPVGRSPVGIAVNPSANWIYIANLDDGTMSVIDGVTNKVIDTISVGKTPYDIAVNPLSNKIYVTDIITNTVSIIDGETNNVTSKILVGKKPTGVAIDIPKDNNRLYVANYDSDSVSVIDTVTHSMIGNITSVGDSPVGLAVNSITSRLYVSNIASNTVSVVDTKAVNSDNIINNKTKSNIDAALLPTSTTVKKNNTAVLKEIPVNPTWKESYSGEDSLINLPTNVGFPLLASHITINPYENKAYITNTGSNTISIINGESNEVAVRLTFNVNPPNSGEIQCDGLRSISENSTSYDRGQKLQCIAMPERGYTFASWSDLVNDPNSNPLTLEVSSFGTLTANFRSAITPEIYLFAIGGIAGATSVFVGWYYKYGQRRYVNRYLTRIQSTYDTLHEKDKLQCILQLQSIRRELIYLFKKGSLSDSHYNILDKKTADYIETVRDEEKQS